jgi:hypothetical protein
LKDGRSKFWPIICSDVGRPKWGMISLKSMVAAVEALLLVTGKASIHPVKVSVKIKRYLMCLIGGHISKIHLPV